MVGNEYLHPPSAQEPSGISDDMPEAELVDGRASVLPDAPAQRDFLDYAQYQESLFDLIARHDASAPLTIGIFGDWGIGKTTLLEMLQRALIKGKTQTAWVDVWQFSNDDDIWAAFLQSLLLKVRQELPWYRRALFNLGLLGRRLDWSVITKRALILVLRVAVIAIPLYFSLSHLPASPDKPTPSGVTAAAGTVASAILGWYVLVQPYLQAIKGRVSVDLTGMVKDSPLKTRVSLLDDFKEYFDDMVTGLVGKNGTLVVFIDDLDRCAPERIVQVLDAIRVFVDSPNCVFVMSMDQDVVEQAVRQKFASYEQASEQAREYLEKIFGISFDLPPLSGSQMESFVSNLDVSLPDAQHSTQVFALGQQANPRKVKRTINAFFLLWALAQRRGELRESIRPTRLAKMVVIQHSYRDLYTLLTVSPKDIAVLEAYYRDSTGNSDGGRPPAAANQESREEVRGLPIHLTRFAANESLRRLLTLHDPRTKESEDTGFVAWDNDGYAPLDEEEISMYIRLTRSVSRDRTTVRRTRRVSEPAFIGREMELELLRAAIEDRDKPQVILIEGAGGTGKTSLLRMFGHYCDSRGVRNGIMDLSQFADKEEFYWALNLMIAGRKPKDVGTVTELAGEPATLRANISNLIREIESNGMVVMLDNYDSAAETVRSLVVEEIVPLVAGAPRRRGILVVAGRSLSSLERIENTTWIRQLGAFTVRDVMELLAAHGIEVNDPDLVSALMEKSGGSASTLVNLASQLAEDKSQVP